VKQRNLNQREVPMGASRFLIWATHLTGLPI